MIIAHIDFSAVTKHQQQRQPAITKKSSVTTTVMIVFANGLALLVLILLSVHVTGSLFSLKLPRISILARRRQGNTGSSLSRVLLRSFIVPSDNEKSVLSSAETQSSSNLEETDAVMAQPDITVIVSTSFGSQYLNKRKKIVVPGNCSVGDLKEILSVKFPGKPPVALQHIYFNTRHLRDREIIGDVSALKPVPLFLDMITGTNGYDRIYTVKQALEAYSASMVQQSYLAAKLNGILTGAEDKPPINNVNGESGDNTFIIDRNNANVDRPMESGMYADALAKANASLYIEYARAIEQALNQEKEGETASADTAAWRGRDLQTRNYQQQGISPLKRALATQFDLNFQGVVNLSFYTVILLVFSFLSGSSGGLLLSIIPVIWLSKLHNIRYLSKVVRNLAICTCLKYDFLIPMLPAPMQVLAKELTNKYHSNDHFFRSIPISDDIGDNFVSDADNNSGDRDRDVDDNDDDDDDDENKGEYIVLNDHPTNTRQNDIGTKTHSQHEKEQEEEEEEIEETDSFPGFVSRGVRAVHEQDDYDEYEA